jgi:phosphomethylpyrimidine synthase
MKITHEVREFARLNPSPLVGEGNSAKQSAVRGPDENAEAGMAEMSKRFHEEGGEIYVSAE